MSSDSAPLPTLPLEVKGHILRFCDVQTLGRASRVCLAFLELAGPLLYRDIVIRGRPQLEMLIRSDSVLETIARFVSLAQMKTFTYVLLGRKIAGPQDISRPLVRVHVVLDKVTIDLRESGTDLAASNTQTDIALSSFNPVHLHILANPMRYSRLGRYILVKEQPYWLRLRTITFTNAISADFLWKAKALICRDPLLDLTIDLSGETSWEEILHDVQTLCDELVDEEDGDVASPAFGRVQVWLSDEDEVALAKKMFEDEDAARNFTSLDVGVKVTTPA